jgi:hypothetical protein
LYTITALPGPLFTISCIVPSIIYNSPFLYSPGYPITFIFSPLFGFNLSIEVQNPLELIGAPANVPYNKPTAISYPANVSELF